MEILMLLAMGVLLFLGIRMFMQRQAGKMNEKIQEEVTPETARQAALSLSDDQHKVIYQAIAGEDARRALALFREATGAPVKDCVVAVQALHRYPQAAPSELKFAEDFNLQDDDGQQVQDEYVEDAIDDVRQDLSGDDSDSGSPLAEADPNTGRILGDNAEQVPDIPGGQSAETKDDDDVDAKARELLEQSGFDPEQELTIPEEWSAEDDDEQAGFHLEVQRGDEKITLSHEDLEPWVHDQLHALLRDDHVEEAAELLSQHSPLTTEEAHRFLVVFKDQS
ncbi:MAG: hypothetical protein ACTMHH_07970 [Nesterenkonia sp.]